jgi:predicted kinase
VTKPTLTIVTGRPASGKTTLSRILSREIRCPLLSRDEFKEGYLNTIEASHVNVDHAVATAIYETFFQVIELLLSKRISLVAEAAFQHKLWQPKLMSYLNIAAIRIVVCEISPGLALTRYTDRLAADPSRESYHGDQAELAKETGYSLITSYIEPDIPVPTLQVNTTDKYDPGIPKILAFIRSYS